MVQCRNGGFRLVPQMEHIDLYHQRLDEAQPHHERFGITEDFDHAYRCEVGDFVRWVRGEIENPCLTWEQGLHCVEMMEAACVSMAQDGRWVDLPAMKEV